MITETKTESIELENVGPIQHLSIPIPEGGGVIILRGGNGVGKTHALNGVSALYNASARKGLRNSDGVPSVHVSGLGVSVRLGRSNTIKGELVCESLDGRVDPSQLVDPGIKDPLAADAKRLATLIRLAGVTIKPEHWVTAIGLDPAIVDVAPLCVSDPIATADAIRRRLHDAALSRERLAESAAGESSALVKSIADVDLSAESDSETLGQRYAEAVEKYGAASSRQDAFVSASERQASAKESLSHVLHSGVDVDKLQSELAHSVAIETDLADTIKDRQAEQDRIREQLKALEVEIHELNYRRLTAVKKSAELRNGIEQTKQHQARISELESVLNQPLPSPVTEEQIFELKSKRDTALEAVRHGEVVRRAKSTKSKAEALAQEAEMTGLVAEKLRTLARSTDAILEQSLIDAGFSTVKVHDGRLCVQSDRGLEPFSDLSHGERWRMALDLAAAGLPKGSVLPVCQEAFESLDPDNRRHINELAKSRGLIILTAEATDGVLRAEVLA